MKKFLVVTSALVAGLTVGLAQAEDAKGEGKGKGRGGDPVKRAEGMIKNLDKDNNGTLSKEEFAAGAFAAKMKEKHGDDVIDKMFASRDTNKDGQLDKAELSAPSKAKGDRGKGKREKGDRGGDKDSGTKDKAEGKSKAE